MAFLGKGGQGGRHHHRRGIAPGQVLHFDPGTKTRQHIGNRLHGGAIARAIAGTGESGDDAIAHQRSFMLSTDPGQIFQRGGGVGRANTEQCDQRQTKASGNQRFHINRSHLKILNITLWRWASDTTP